MLRIKVIYLVTINYQNKFVTGIVLANASIDIAQHDILINLNGQPLVIVPYNINQLNQYQIGLIEGDGTITVDLIRNRIYRIRIIISLKNNEANLYKLKQLHNNIGGNIRQSKKYVILEFTSKKDVMKVLEIIKKYPFLTSRKICQYNFAQKCLNNEIKVEEFIKERNSKYFNQLYILNSLLVKYANALPIYFPCWLSGFIETEGNFKLIISKTGGIKSYQFKIGQNYDYFILEKIKIYLNSNHKITKDNNMLKDQFRISIGGPISCNIIYKHFKKYPLLGEKKFSYYKWLLVRSKF